MQSGNRQLDLGYIHLIIFIWEQAHQKGRRGASSGLKSLKAPHNIRTHLIMRLNFFYILKDNEITF